MGERRPVRQRMPIGIRQRVSRGASMRFTRTPMPWGNVAQSDSECQTEFGASYKAAKGAEVLTAWKRGQVTSIGVTPTFNVIDGNYSYAVQNSTSGITLSYN